jgi:DNA-binding Lrp family transcriptional regulator
MPPQKIDSIDITILRNLQKDARTKYTDIAEQCNVSVDTIIKRFRKMKRGGIITNTTALLDPRKLGYEVIANFSVDAEPQAIPEILTHIKKQEDIIFTTHSLGEYDIFVIAISKNMNDMNKLKEYIQSHNMIREVKTSIWVDKYLLCPENFELEQLLGETI